MNSMFIRQFGQRPAVLKALVLTAIFLTSGTLILNSQNKAQTYFVDGYHGGFYGHYPAGYTSKIVEGLDSIPEWKIGLEIEPVTWDIVALDDRVAYRKFRDYLLDGSRVEYTNPAYGQPYMYNISGESIIRQFKFGFDVLHRHFPDLKIESYCTAEPCFTSALPGILSSYGFKYSTTKCPDTIFGGWFSPSDAELEWWTGPDGESRILNSPRPISATLDRYCAWSSSDHSMTKAYVDASFASGIKHPIGMTYQDAGWKVIPWMDLQPEEEGEFVSAPEYAEPQYILWTQYFEKMAPELDIKERTYSQEDMHASLCWGAQSLQRISRMVRHLENKVVQTEKLCAMSVLADAVSYPQDDIRLAWEGLMLSQHHDSWIGSSGWYMRVKPWAENADKYCDEAVEHALSQRVTNSEDKITVYNTTASARCDRVTVRADSRFNSLIDARGKQVPSQRESDCLSFIAEAPAFGWTTFSLSEEKCSSTGLLSSKKKGRSIILSNDIYTITFNPEKGGAISSIKDRKSGKELIDRKSSFPFNGLSAYYPEERRFHRSDETPAEVKILCCGDVYATVQVNGKINGVGYIQTVTLTAGSPVIDCSLTVDWKEKSQPIGDHKPADGDRYDKSGNRLTWNMEYYDSRKKMSLTFPTPQEGRIVKNAPFDVCESTLDDTFYSRFDSLKHNVILNWVDLETEKGSLALFSDHTTSYLYGAGFPLGLTVQYVGKGQWNADHNVDGPSRMDYALTFHNGKWDKDGISALSENWNEKLKAVSGARPAGQKSLLALDGTGYQMVAAYFEGGSLYVRIFNESGDNSVRTIIPGFTYTSAEEVELDGRIKEELGNGSLSISMPRFGFRTIKFSF